MISNNKVTNENLKYILKEIYNNPKTRYIKTKDLNIIKYGNKEIARYKNDPKLWYVLGVVEQGLLRIFYADGEVLQIRAIFGRSGEETPVAKFMIRVSERNGTNLYAAVDIFFLIPGRFVRAIFNQIIAHGCFFS